MTDEIRPLPEDPRRQRIMLRSLSRDVLLAYGMAPTEQILDLIRRTARAVHRDAVATNSEVNRAEWHSALIVAVERELKRFEA